MKNVLLAMMFIFSMIFTACGGGGTSDGPVSEETFTLSVVPDGNGTIENLNDSYKNGETAELTANPSDGWRFDHWEINGEIIDENSVSIQINGNESIKVVFIRQFKLTAAASGSGKVTCTPAKSAYDAGTQVTLKAVPSDATWKFLMWSGDASGNNDQLTITMDKDKTATAVFIRPATIKTDQIKDVIYAAYAGIGYGITDNAADDAMLYRAMVRDVNSVCDAAAWLSIIDLLNNDMDTLISLGMKGKGGLFVKKEQWDFNPSVSGLNVKLIIKPDWEGMISTNQNDPSKATVIFKIGIPSSGYSINNVTYKGTGDSDIIFTGKALAFFNFDTTTFGLYFDSFDINVNDKLTASYSNPAFNVQYKSWKISVSGTGNEGKMMNYYIGPLSLYGLSEWVKPSYDNRFYRLNGTFSINGADYFYDMLYGQLDAVYKNLNPDARYIGMQGSIRIPSLNGELVNISTQKSDLYKNIFNGSNIDNLKKDNLTGSIEISNSPDNGLWKTGIMNLTQAGFIGDWTAAFNDNGSVTIGPDNITVFLWQKTLEPIK